MTLKSALGQTALADILVDDPSLLGEGVQWDSERGRLWWTDIHGRRLLSSRQDGTDYRVIETPDRLCSFTFDPDGVMLAAFASGLFVYDPDSGDRREIAPFETDQATTRLNDGRCDRAGRFLTGGVEETGLKPLTSLIRYDGTGAPETLLRDVGCTNSLAFSPDGTVMYFADTAGKDIFAFDYDQASGAISNKRVFATLGPDEGRPDGSCVDAQGRLWNAQFNGGRVQCFNPDGSRGPVVYLPCPQVTCPCFGGQDMGTLFITTARENLSQADIAAAPLSGALFAIDAMQAFGAVGLPESGFGKSLGGV